MTPGQLRAALGLLGFLMVAAIGAQGTLLGGVGGAASTAALMAAAGLCGLLLLDWAAEPLIPHRALPTLAAFGAFVVWAVTRSFGIDAPADPIKRLTQILIVYEVFVGAMVLARVATLPSYIGMHLVWLLALSGAMVLLGGRFVQASGLFANPNSQGTAFFYLTFFALWLWRFAPSARMRHLFGICAAIAVVLVLLSTTRASVLGLLAAGGTLLGWPLIARSRLTFSSWFVLLLFGIAATFTAYLLLSEILQALSAVTMSVGKNADTRSVVWVPMLVELSRRPWLGFGTGVDATAITGLDLSAHCLYLDIAFQYGVIGLALFAVVVATLWAALYPIRHATSTRLGGAWIVGILVEQTFNVTLVQNWIPVGVLFWVIAAVTIADPRTHPPSTSGQAERTRRPA